MNQYEKINFKNIYHYNKKNKKTILITKFDLEKIKKTSQNKLKSNYSIKVKKIYLELNINSIDYNSIESVISKIKIFINTEPNISNSFLSLPGFICEFTFINPKLLELNILFENFFPNGIPFPIDEKNLIYDNIIDVKNKKNFYLMILFDKLLKNDILISSYLEYELNNINLQEEQIYLNDYSSIIYQETQLCKTNTLLNNKCLKKVRLLFNHLCCGFWIKMHKLDYENIKNFKIILNGQDRLNIDFYQLELLELKKKYIEDSIIFFFNLDFDFKELRTVKTINEIKLIYSNSINFSRIDSAIFEFEFDVKVLIGENIYICSLNLNLLKILNDKYGVNIKYI